MSLKKETKQPELIKACLSIDEKYRIFSIQIALEFIGIDYLYQNKSFDVGIRIFSRVNARKIGNRFNVPSAKLDDVYL